MNNYDFRLINISSIPIMDKEKLKIIARDIGNKCYTNTIQKNNFIKYVLENLTEKCAYCGTVLTIQTVDEVDHFIPKNNVNCNETDNLVITCRKCNRSKYNYVYSRDLYPYEKKYSEIFKRNEIGQIVPIVNEEEYFIFAEKMKFNSIYYSITYIIMLINKYLTICKNDNLYKELVEFRNKLEIKGKIWTKEE